MQAATAPTVDTDARFLRVPRAEPATLSYPVSRSQLMAPSGLAPPVWSADRSILSLPDPEVALFGSIAPGWRLTQPLLLTVRWEMVGQEHQCIVFEPGFNLYGIGITIAEALAEYTSMLLDLFQELVDSEQSLSSHLCQKLERLRSLISSD